MLPDLLLLEEYFEEPETVQFYEDIMRRYGVEPVKKAVQTGHIALRCVHCGPHRGRLVLWLTEKGRSFAAMQAGA